MRSARTPELTPELDLIILRAFHQDKGRNCALIAADEISRKLRRKVSESFVVRRAVELGLTKPKKNDLRWSQEQDDYLRERIHLPFAEIQRQFNTAFKHRTLSAIVARVGRLGGTRSLRSSCGFTMSELARHLHVSKLSISAWRQHGYIRGSKPTNRDWIFTREAVRQFVLDHPEVIDLTRVDKYWLLGLLDVRTTPQSNLCLPDKPAPSGQEGAVDPRN